MKEAKITTREVAWVGTKPIKYQSSLEFELSERRTIHLFGEPASTKALAWENLVTEYSMWSEAMVAFKEVINKRIL